MPRKSGIVKPKVLLHDVRREVSRILERPFTEKTDHQIFRPDKRVLALWAADCAERVLPFFEEAAFGDDRPRTAIAECRRYAATGVFRMADIRRRSLDAHAAAKHVQEMSAAYAAHAAGQAVATAHVPTHAFGCSVYALRAVAARSNNTDDGLAGELAWQLEQLRRLAGKLDLRNE